MEPDRSYTILWSAGSTVLRQLDEVCYCGEISSLHVFCRIDVTLLAEKGKGIHYVVHEVERGLNTALFGRLGEEYLTRLANMFLREYSKWFKHQSSTL